MAGPQTLRFGAIALRSFEGLGLDQETEVNILAAVNNYIYGFVQREVAWQGFASRAEPAAAPAREDLSAGHLAARTKLHGDESFAFGLECLLDGFAVRVARAGGNGESAYGTDNSGDEESPP